MNVAVHTSDDVRTPGGGQNPPCTGLTPSALPEVQTPVRAEDSQTGVSTRNVPSQSGTLPLDEAKTPHWYVLRTTYGREKKAHDYMASQGVTTFYPTLTTVKLVDGKRRTVTESRIPNLFFAYGTEDEIKRYVYDNANLPYLRFYYRHYHAGNTVEIMPLTIPDNQMESLKIICAAEASDVIVTSTAIPKFEKGQPVRIIGGAFKGVVGRVARYQGQQRVAVVVDGLVTAVTAYVPSAFLECRNATPIFRDI